ncbi:hypothetical protein GCM10020221_36660 [Streptomyces thioluteus]|uniref:Integral membrane protein n=1 Tax=Streptomyces thioluteus TaxID=66431 RepID=A0ABP6JMW1_STRTU
MSSQKYASLRYTALRFGLLIGSFAVVWVLCWARVIPLGVGSSNIFWMLLLSLVISAPLSWVLLRKQRGRHGRAGRRACRPNQGTDHRERGPGGLSARPSQERGEVDTRALFVTSRAGGRAESSCSPPGHRRVFRVRNVPEPKETLWVPQSCSVNVST